MKIVDILQHEFLKRIPDSIIRVENAIRNGFEKPLSQTVKPTATQMLEQNLRIWKNAIAEATDPDNPQRGTLSRLYENLYLDNHLASVIDTIIIHVQRSAFKMVDKNGVENKELSKLLERLWFDDLIDKVIYSKFQGTTLLEFFDLDQNLEVKHINEIPQANFVAKKGIVIAEEGNNVGISYKEDPYKRYYTQIGKDDDLGMLSQLAPIILAKKLGLGSWLDYIDKFGVPPLFITTDREDNGRLNDLYEAASNFKSNHFVVGRGNEKFEIGKTESGAAEPFDKLIERANSEISKRILGGTAATDEKSFVGAAEIQYKLTVDRFESHKLFFKYIFNSQIKPILIGLSPVYKAFENHTFEFDNSESLTQKELLEAINTLSNHYVFDEKEIEKIVGVPIVGQKNTATTGGVDAKK